MSRITEAALLATTAQCEVMVTGCEAVYRAIRRTLVSCSCQSLVPYWPVALVPVAVTVVTTGLDQGIHFFDSTFW